MKKSMRNLQQAGFTLVELMIVVTIIGILAGVAIPNLHAYRERAAIASAVNTGHQILNAFTVYAVTSEGNLYPPEFTTFDELRTIVNTHGSWLTEKQLAPFRDPETNTSTFDYRCWCCQIIFPYTCDICDWSNSSSASLGPERFSLRIPLLSIERPPAEMLFLDINSMEGVSIKTGDPTAPAPPSAP